MVQLLSVLVEEHVDQYVVFPVARGQHVVVGQEHAPVGLDRRGRGLHRAALHEGVGVLRIDVVSGTDVLFVDDPHVEVLDPFAAGQELLQVGGPQPEAARCPLEIDRYAAVVGARRASAPQQDRGTLPVGGEVDGEVARSGGRTLVVVYLGLVLDLDQDRIERTGLEVPVRYVALRGVIGPAQGPVAALGYAELQRVLRSLHESLDRDFAPGDEPPRIRARFGRGDLVEFGDDAHAEPLVGRVGL